MTRDDQIRATVAAGMQDSGEIFDAMQSSARIEKLESGTNSVLFDISLSLAEAAMEGTTESHRQTLAIRLLNTLESYARAALTTKADDDLPQPDDEENEE